MTAFAFSPPVQPNSSVSLPYVLAQSAVPVVLAPNATWNNSSGNFTLGTSIVTIYSGGVWMYFAGVGVNSSGGGPISSGLYWCVMISATVGQAYALPSLTTNTNPFVLNADNTNFIPYIPLASQLSLLPVTAGSHVQTTGTNITLTSMTMPGNSMGANGVLMFTLSYRTLSNANTKYAGYLVGSASNLNNYTTVTSFFANYIPFRNRGVQNSQVYQSIGGSTQISSIDTSANQQIILVAKIETATDFMVQEGFTIELLQSY
jgi:hypothetical protein